MEVRQRELATSEDSSERAKHCRSSDRVMLLRYWDRYCVAISVGTATFYIFRADLNTLDLTISIAKPGTTTHWTKGDRPTSVHGKVGIKSVYVQLLRTTTLSHSL